MDIKDKSVECNAKGKNTKIDFSTLSPIVQCYNCQGYRHVAANYPNPFRVNNKPLVTKPKSDPEESFCQSKEPEDSDSNENIMGDNLVESSILAKSFQSLRSLLISLLQTLLQFHSKSLL